MRHTRSPSMIGPMETRMPRVVIAGGGVAGLEAMLGLRHVLGEGVEVEILAPDPEFVLRPFLVGEPFGLGPALRLDLEEVAREHDARLHRATLTAVHPRSRAIQTGDGEQLEYDALLIGIGAQARASVPGALHFGSPGSIHEFEDMLSRLETGELANVVFAAPTGEHWTLPIYELSLLTAAHLSARDSEDAQLTVATHESEPLGMFGEGSPAILRELLDEAGVELQTGVNASRFEDGALHLAAGEAPIAADRVVAIPRLEVPDIEGIPQRTRGFIPTDAGMRVEGARRIWAAGDATWFPIKQGGLACQQADVAVSAIAAELGARSPIISYRPTLRSALLTGSLPRHFRARPGQSSRTEVSAGALWWPVGKVAGRHLGPYLARRRRWNVPSSSQLSDLDSVANELDVEREEMEAVALCLAAAEADADAHDLAGALEWLSLAEEISLVLPPPWPRLREEWRRALGATERTPAEERSA